MWVNAVLQYVFILSITMMKSSSVISIYQVSNLTEYVDKTDPKISVSFGDTA